MRQRPPAGGLQINFLARTREHDIAMIVVTPRLVTYARTRLKSFVLAPSRLCRICPNCQTAPPSPLAILMIASL
jgi:hypothetical protein